MKKVTSFVFATLLSVMFVSATPTTGLQFSGAAASFIDLGVQPAFSPAQFTIEVWVNFQDLKDSYIFDNENWGTGAEGFVLHNTNSKIDILIGSGNRFNLTSKNVIQINTWNHIVATYSGTELKLYINGVLDGTLAVTAPMVASTSKLRIGEGSVWGDRRFIGQMSDLRFLNVVRTEAEISADMTSTLTGNESGLVAGWKMNEGAGTTSVDITGNYNLTIPAEVAWFNLAAGVNTVYNNSLNITSAIYGRNLEVTNNTKGNAQVAIYSVNGQKIMENVVASGATIQKQLTNTKGAYILKSIAADGSSFSKKFIIAE